MNTLTTHNGILPLSLGFHSKLYGTAANDTKNLANIFNAITNPVTIATVTSIIFRVSVVWWVAYVCGRHGYFRRTADNP